MLGVGTKTLGARRVKVLSIKADIDPYSNDMNVSDEILLEKLNLAANNEAGRKHKLGIHAQVNVLKLLRWSN